MRFRNPFRSEAEAFHFLLLTVAAFAAIALASLLGGAWAGVPVFVVVTAGAILLYVQGRAERPAPTAPPHRGGPDERRILVVANETLAGRVLLERICSLCRHEYAQVLIVAPALTSAVRHWASDVDGARARAQQRLDQSLAHLAEAGVTARGEIGDDEPLQAIEDALRTFGADEIIISTHPEGRSNWLERGIVASARERFAVPITHVVVDLDAEASASGEAGSHPARD